MMREGDRASAMPSSPAGYDIATSSPSTQGTEQAPDTAMTKTYLLMLLAAVSSSLAAAVGLADLHAYSQETMEGLNHRAQEPVRAFVHDYRAWLIFGLTFFGTAPSVAISVISAMESKRRQKQRVAGYLKRVHERSFPHHEEGGKPAGGMDLTHRVSLFVPRRASWHNRHQVLRCEFRTDQTQSKRAWPLGETRRKGIVARAWYVRAAVTADPPNNAAPESVQDYLASTWMDEQDRQASSWPDAAVRAEPIITTPTSDPVAVLLVEAREKPIAADELQWDAPTLAMLLKSR